MKGLAGGFEHFWDNSLLDLAHRRFNQARGRALGPYELLPTDENVVRCGFVATRDLWRLALGDLDSGPASGWPPVIGWAEPGWVSLEVDPPQIRGGVGDDAGTHGDLGMRAMLETGWLQVVTGLARPQARFDVAPASMYRLYDEWDWGYALGLSHGEVDRHEVLYDQELECIRSWTSLVDGRVAQRLVLAPITPL